MSKESEKSNIDHFNSFTTEVCEWKKKWTNGLARRTRQTTAKMALPGLSLNQCRMRPRPAPGLACH